MDRSYLDMLLAWLEQAIVILEAARLTPPPATQSERVENLLFYLSAPVPPTALPPRSAQDLRQDLKNHFAAASDAVLQVVTKTQPALESVFYAAYRNLAYRLPVVTAPQTGPGNVGFLAAATGTVSPPTVYALRVTASLFGANAPKQTTYTQKPPAPDPMKMWTEWEPKDAGDEEAGTVFLDNAFDEIMPESYIAIKKPNSDAIVFTIDQAVTRPRTAYGISGKTTQIILQENTWWNPATDDFKIVRGTVVYAQSEKLDLALEPSTDPIPRTETPNTIDLADLYNGLKAGRWLIVSGERTDIADVTGVKGSELAMLHRIEQIDASSPDDNTHSRLILANDLRYTYKPDTVTIYGNVAKATHGETRNEVLGSGDGSQALQSFTLKQSPLTHTAAPNPRGVDSTLHVHVNDVEWHEVENLAQLSPADRKFITRTSEDERTTVIFGNGERGARLPTGIENVKAIYRNGIGKPGNVKADQISLLATRPLGVKAVINPLPATGGADRESRDQARKNTPLAVLALDRLVSTKDYEDFTRRFAGIGKASAAHLSDGSRQLVHVTIAGADDIPIEKSDDLYRNLVRALHDFGDPYQPIQVELRELMLIAISANVRLLPDHLWEAVAKNIRAKLLDVFSFERRELGQDVLLSEVISAIQLVEGVAYVDVDLLRGIPEKKPDEQNPGKRRRLTPEEIVKEIADPLLDEHGNCIKEPLTRLVVNLADFESKGIRPAQLAFLSPEVEATLVLNEVKS